MYNTSQIWNLVLRTSKLIVETSPLHRKGTTKKQCILELNMRQEKLSVVEHV